MEKILTWDEIKSLLIGAERIYAADNAVNLCRFTEAEQEVFSNNADFMKKTFSASNMIISLLTDGDGLAMEYVAAQASSRKFAYIDVKVNGALAAHAGTDDVSKDPSMLLEVPLPGKRSVVEIFLPPLASVKIKSLKISNASFCQKSPRTKRIISYGDSITQGYDAKYPVLSYTSILAESIGAELINKAIGGDIFNPALVRSAHPQCKIDAVTVAYGTNDWNRCPLEQILNNCREFFAELEKQYPTVPVLVILPIWRKDLNKDTAAGDFLEVRQKIRQIAEQYANVQIIDDLSLTPHLPEFYSDSYLHPNDMGFLAMGKNLLGHARQLQPELWN